MLSSSLVLTLAPQATASFALIPGSTNGTSCGMGGMAWVAWVAWVAWFAWVAWANSPTTTTSPPLPPAISALKGITRCPMERTRTFLAPRGRLLCASLVQRDPTDLPSACCNVRRECPHGHFSLQNWRSGVRRVPCYGQFVNRTNRQCE
jgi:hypothetical protein